VKKNAKLARSLNPYIKDIEDQNAKLVFKGGDFYVATEERLTEEIAELYGQVNSYPGRPGNTQIERTNSLEAEMLNVKKKMEEFSMTKLEKINTQLLAAKLEPLKVPTEEEWRKGPDSGSGSGTNEYWKEFGIHRLGLR
jgi:hypothetical protein